jgi:1-acyl-sn-glycerol-3-phosphate acyltransferase
MKKLLGILCFPFKLYVGAVFVLFLILFYPFFLLVLSRKSWKKHSFKIFVVWSFLMQVCTLVIVLKKNRPQLPDGPCIIVSNHTSYFDIFLMYSIVPHHPFLFMGKAEILSYPLVKRFFIDLNIPVHRKNQRLAAMSFIQAKQALKEGWSIVLFPEGGIPDDHVPAMIPFKDGAFKLAKSAKVPIVSMTFLDNYHVFSEPLHVDYAHPGISRVVFHPVISAEEVSRLTEAELSAKTFELISAPLKERGLM